MLFSPWAAITLPRMKKTLPHQVLEQIQKNGRALTSAKALIGLDGFVDTILHVVDKRESATKFKRLAKMKGFAERIDAAAGLSANFEMVPQMVKLGGNGPIMANALGSYGPEVNYIGNLGYPNIHPVFADFAKRAKVHSIAEAAYTDAIEFEDGKLMCGKTVSLKDVTWARLTKHVPEKELVKLFSQSSLIALVNWTMIPFMSDIFAKVLVKVAPKLKGPKRWVFFDLADPAKRTPKDIAEALKLISKFEKHFRVILGLNLQESRQIGHILGFKAPDQTHEAVTEHARRLQAKLKVDTVVIHPTSFAAAADASGAFSVAGPFTPKPKITTGAGDHFNAGFCVGRLLGCDLAGSLQFGVATSGFYVRNAKSPTMKDLQKFLRSL